LYGITPNNGGNVFKIDSVGNFTVLHSFMGPEGSGPAGLVQGQDDLFYGVTSGGGTSPNCPPAGCGTIFKIDSTGTLTVLHQFTGTDAQKPINIYRGSDGYFYGTTSGAPRGDET
jgi:uncharacterized repeat protein (TIGR03803 family)